MSGVIEAALAQNWPIYWFDQLDSTNEEARRRVDKGEMGPCWIAARQQTSGRGRRGRSWHSEVGNLYATALFPFDHGAQTASQICFTTGLAVIDAVDDVGVDASSIQLKWPNDVRVNGAKLSGILIETGAVGGNLMWIAAGIGVNLRSAPETDQPTISVADLGGGPAIDPEGFLESLSLAFKSRLKQLMTSGFESVRRDWLSRSEGLDKRVIVTVGESQIEGVVRDMDATGALVLETGSGQTRLITAGDVRLMS